ncbi:MAG: DeoR family transcriptional regulator [Patescibacteria group bacterium]
MDISPEQRKLRILKAVVREYLETAEPVSSGVLVVKYRLGVSPATVRNDMVELTERGLLEQPHTSAGRRPTEAGYRLYVSEFIDDGFRVIEDVLRQVRFMAAELELERQTAARDFARYMAELTGETAFVSHHGAVFMTGISNLFRKPEFRTPELMQDFSLMFDQIEDLVRDVRPRMTTDITIYIGGENPFCPRLSSVLTRWDSGDGLIGIIGPTRMDYEMNVGLMRSVHDALAR